VIIGVTGMSSIRLTENVIDSADEQQEGEDAQLRGVLHYDDETNYRYENNPIQLSLLARMTMLCHDQNSLAILNRIYGGATKEQRRACLDDRQRNERNAAFWSELVNNFFNNPSWAPKNPVADDGRVNSLDPRIPPEPPGWTAEQLQTAFQAQRTQYSLLS
jgi:hypothetical protein